MTELNPQASTVPDYGSDGDLSPSATAPAPLGLSVDSWVKIGVLAPLFVAVYWLVLRWLWDKTNPIWGENNWGHSICIPLVGLYYLYYKRDELEVTPVKTSWSGLIFFVGGLLAFGASVYPLKNQFFQGFAMILTLFGLILLLCGWRIMKIAYFPIFYLVCGIPWPPLVYSYIASPLQGLAAKVAVVTLRFTGVNAYRTGTKINIGGITEKLVTLNVAEACAGLRSLMTFITVALAVAFLSARPLWQKIIVTLSAVPIAIFCNVIRVAGQGLLRHYVPEPYGEQISIGFAHQFVGFVMLIPAFFMIVLVGWILDHLFVEEVDEKDLAAKRAAAPGILDIPRHAPLPAMIPPSRHVAPRAAAPTPGVTPPPASSKPQAAAPVAPAPASAPKPAMAPPRPGTIPPRPGIAGRPPTPPRPTTPPLQQRPPQPPSEGA